MKLIWKQISRAESEYMNIQSPPHTQLAINPYIGSKQTLQIFYYSSYREHQVVQENEVNQGIADLLYVLLYILSVPLHAFWISSAVYIKESALLNCEPFFLNKLLVTSETSPKIWSCCVNISLL